MTDVEERLRGGAMLRGAVYAGWRTCRRRRPGSGAAPAGGRRRSGAGGPPRPRTQAFLAEVGRSIVNLVVAADVQAAQACRRRWEGGEPGRALLAADPTLGRPWAGFADAAHDLVHAWQAWVAELVGRRRAARATCGCAVTVAAVAPPPGRRHRRGLRSGRAAGGARPPGRGRARRAGPRRAAGPRRRTARGRGPAPPGPGRPRPGSTPGLAGRLREAGAALAHRPGRRARRRGVSEHHDGRSACCDRVDALGRFVRTVSPHLRGDMATAAAPGDRDRRRPPRRAGLGPAAPVRRRTRSSRWPGRPAAASRACSTPSPGWSSHRRATCGRPPRTRTRASGAPATPADLLDWLGVAPERALQPGRARSTARTRRPCAGWCWSICPMWTRSRPGTGSRPTAWSAIVDLVVWVLDPQKYADQTVHEDYLRHMGALRDVTVVVFNQIDRLTAADADRCRADLGRLVAADGLPEVPVLATSAADRGRGRRGPRRCWRRPSPVAGRRCCGSRARSTRPSRRWRRWSARRRAGRRGRGEPGRGGRVWPTGSPRRPACRGRGRRGRAGLRGPLGPARAALADPAQPGPAAARPTTPRRPSPPRSRSRCGGSPSRPRPGCRRRGRRRCGRRRAPTWTGCRTSSAAAVRAARPRPPRAIGWWLLRAAVLARRRWPLVGRLVWYGLARLRRQLGPVEPAGRGPPDGPARHRRGPAAAGGGRRRPLVAVLVVLLGRPIAAARARRFRRAPSAGCATPRSTVAREVVGAGPAGAARSRRCPRAPSSTGRWQASPHDDGRAAGASRLGMARFAALNLWWGVWARLWPRHFFDTFPGFGQRWTAAYPPYNEHLVVDLGSTFLTLGFLLAAGAAVDDRRRASARARRRCWSSTPRTWASTPATTAGWAGPPRGEPRHAGRRGASGRWPCSASTSATVPAVGPAAAGDRCGRDHPRLRPVRDPGATSRSPAAAAARSPAGRR